MKDTTMDPTDDLLIRIKGVTLRFGDYEALSNIEFDLPKNKVFSLVGPNGGGKTVLLKILAGLVAPSEGHIKRKKDLHLVYVPSDIPNNMLLPITVTEFLKLGFKEEDVSGRIHSLLARFKLEPYQNKRIKDLSKGMRQRVFLLRGLMHNPELLLLDEPDQNLDMDSRQDLYQLLTDLQKERGFSLVAVSHNGPFALSSSDQVICLDSSIQCITPPETVKDYPVLRELFHLTDDTAIAFHLRHHHSSSPKS